MAKFEPIVQWLLFQEDDHHTPGKIVNLGDGAGWTRLGITSKNFAAAVPFDFFTTMPFDKAVQVAKNVYHDEYWRHLNGDLIEADEVAAPLLSFAVNRNVKIAVTYLQRVLGVTDDGVLGLITISQLNQKDPAIVAKLFRAEWANYYHRVAGFNPNDDRFLAGWLNRASFPYPSAAVPPIYG
jgi:lysozyme family protein